MTAFFKLWFIVVFFWSFSLTSAFAAMYSFVDKAGVVHFSNVPTDSRYIPLRGFRFRGAKASRIINPKKYEPHIKRVAGQFGIDPLLIRAVIKAESNFDYLAVSPKGAQGLMQLMPGTARDMRVANPFDPQQNITGGTKYLRKMLDVFNDDLPLALAAYNAGPEHVKKYGSIPKFPETVKYVKRVLRNYKRYQASSSFGKGG